MNGSKARWVAVGVLAILLAGGCGDDGAGPQSVQYPTDPVPADGATDQPVHTTLWTFTTGSGN